jgi:NTE family protein
MAAPRVGLALGGGGMRGMAHVGVLRVLRQAGLPVGAVAGTSIGALVGAAYAAGVDLRALPHQAGLLALLNLRGLPPALRAALRRRLQASVLRWAGESATFAGLALPLAVVAADLLTGEEVVLRDGPLLPALLASAAMPGPFLPVSLAGRLLGDGGLVNVVPVAAARALGADVVVAVDVSVGGALGSPSDPRADPERIARGRVDRTLDLTTGTLSALRLAQEPPDLLLRPQLPVAITEARGFLRYRQAIAAGEAAMRAALPRLHAALRHGVPVPGAGTPASV